MTLEELCEWVRRSECRRRVLRSLTQPLTASQCAQRTGLSLDCCKGVLGRFARRRLVVCLNDRARTSRVYGLTRMGVLCRRQVRETLQWPHVPYELPEADWTLYGWVCFRHRAAVLRGLSEPGPAAAVRRKARFLVPTLRMSVNNVRDVLRQFVLRGLVKVELGAGRRRVYTLTKTGVAMRTLLLRAEGAPWH